jgi:alcohol dehydrogenase class IV
VSERSEGTIGHGTSFDLALPRKILFGPGRADELAALVPTLGSRVLLCTGSDPSRHRHLLGDVEPVATVRVTREPLVDDARVALDEARAAGADSVVAIGGGSVLDLAKAIAVLLGNGTDPLDHLEVVGRGLPIERPAVPYVAVPTTAGTGAEATANAVLGSPEHGRKASIRSPHMLAAVALVDPLLTLRCPPAVTASSGLDALTQCLEPFVSPRANPATDAVAADGLRRGARSLRRAFENGDDRAAREDMALCSLFGGISLANAKLGAVHGVAGVVGGMIDAPHGAVCAALLAPVVEANVRALRQRAPDSPALGRYATVARLLTGKETATVEDAVAWLRETVAELEVPSLGEVGLASGQHEEVAEKSARSSSMQGNPVVLSTDELVAALAAAG